MITATAEIDFSALTHNLGVVRQYAPASKVLAVLKANAYGHGLVKVAEQLDTADGFGVARLGEALKLRKDGIKKSIVLMEGFVSDDDVSLLAKHNLETVVQNKQQLNALLNADLASPINVWLKIDTGMHRLGIEPEETNYFYQSLINSSNVVKPIKLMTHFACADDTTNNLTHNQLQKFSSATKGLLGEQSMANSAAVVAWPQSHADWVRPGVMLYGISPLMGTIGADHNLRPMMTMKSSLIAVRNIKKGEAVGYGAAWRSPKDTVIGVVAMGYGDGYPRHAPSGTPVLVSGREVSLVGRVSMDMITVDLGADSQDNIGDTVVLWGADLPIEKVAEKAGTIAYELICNITRRVALDYINK